MTGLDTYVVFVMETSTLGMTTCYLNVISHNDLISVGAVGVTAHTDF